MSENIESNKLKKLIDDAQYIRFIKLGEKGKFEDYCLTQNKIVLGFMEVDHNATNLDENEIKQRYLELGKTTQTASSYFNQIKKFYDTNTLWITFSKQKLWWGFSQKNIIEKDEYKNTFKEMTYGWYSTDLKGNELTFENISGVLLKIQMFQGTICDIRNNTKSQFNLEDYTKRLLKGEKLPVIQKAETNINNLKESIKEIIQLLQPKDFEYIIDLIFQYSGWKKLTPGGGVEKDLDLDLLMPLTNERAFVQIKSQTNQQEYERYENIFCKNDSYHRMFYVLHTNTQELKINKREKPIHIIYVDEIADLIIELGLTNILMKKVG